MAKEALTIEELEEQLFQLKLEKVIEQAYMQGIEDGRSKYNYPMVLKREDLAEILQVTLPTVDKLTADPNFPRLRTVRARYPRDEVFDWIHKNTDQVDRLLS